jgi:hypothetical protein
VESKVKVEEEGIADYYGLRASPGVAAPLYFLLIWSGILAYFSDLFMPKKTELQ